MKPLSRANQVTLHEVQQLGNCSPVLPGEGWRSSCDWILTGHVIACSGEQSSRRRCSEAPIDQGALQQTPRSAGVRHVRGARRDRRTLLGSLTREQRCEHAWQAARLLGAPSIAVSSLRALAPALQASFVLTLLRSGLARPH